MGHGERGIGSRAHRGSSGAAGEAGEARGPANRRRGSPAPEVGNGGVGDAAELLAPRDSMERTTTSRRSSGSRRRGGAVAVGAGLRQRVHGGFGHGGERARRGVGGANGVSARSGRRPGDDPRGATATRAMQRGWVVRGELGRAMLTSLPALARGSSWLARASTVLGRLGWAGRSR